MADTLPADFVDDMGLIGTVERCRKTMAAMDADGAPPNRGPPRPDDAPAAQCSSRVRMTSSTASAQAASSPSSASSRAC